MKPTGMGMMFQALGLDMGAVQEQARLLLDGVKEFKASLDAARADIAAMNDRLAGLEIHLLSPEERGYMTSDEMRREEAARADIAAMNDRLARLETHLLSPEERGYMTSDEMRREEAAINLPPGCLGAQARTCSQDERMDDLADGMARHGGGNGR